MKAIQKGDDVSTVREAIAQTVELLNGATSHERNRAFDRFSRPHAWQAFRWYRLVRSLEEDLMCHDTTDCRIQVSPAKDGEVRVRLEKPVIRYTRSCLLPPELFACLTRRLAKRGLALGGIAR